MRASASNGRKDVYQSRPSAIESLESRTLLSSSGTPSLSVTISGPVPTTAVGAVKVNDHITVKIANAGTGKFSGRTAVTLYASSDGTFSASDPQLGAITQNLIIPAGASRNVVVRVPEFPQNLDGDYFLVANVAAPTATAQGVSAAAIDISPAEIDFSNAITAVPAAAKPGARIRVTLDVTNFGNVNATGWLGMIFELSSSSDGSNPIQVANVTSHILIKPGGSEKLPLSVPVPLGSPAGNQFIVSVLDPSDVFNSPNRTNNTAISALPVNFT
jgi:uncharacterized membrane protein